MRMKEILLSLSLAGCGILNAIPVDGIVTLDGKPAPDTLVSDGFSFVRTDASGRYRLNTHAKASTIYVHRKAGVTAHPFYFQLTPKQRSYHFALSSAPESPGEQLNILVIGDPETPNMGYLEEIETDIRANPETDFVLIAGDICFRNGVEAHARRLAPGKFPRPVYYCVGNHELDRLKEREAFIENLAPWYYSFECRGVLFVAAPMYKSWGAPLLYDMKDFGDWFRELLKQFPAKQPKILLCHDMPDLVGKEIAGRNGTTRLKDFNFKSILYGHKHYNAATTTPDGLRLFCTTQTTRGGSGFSIPQYRRVVFSANGDFLRSSLHYAGVSKLLSAGFDGKSIWATAGNSGDEVVKVTAVSANGDALELKQNSPLSWTGESSFNPVRVEAVTTLGKTFTAPVHEERHLRLSAALPAETAIADLLSDNEQLFVATIDYAESKNGGIYALDRNTGAIRWFYRTGLSISNNFAQDKTTLFVLDAGGNIHAIAKADGKRRWLNAAPPWSLNVGRSGLVLANGVVVGGYGFLLRGVEAATGSTLWKNTFWKIPERTPCVDKLAVDGEVVFVISALNGLYAHDLATGTVRWNFNKLFLDATAAVGDREIVIGSSSEKKYYRLDQATGKVIPEKTRQFNGIGSASVPVRWRDLLILGTANRGVVALRWDDLSEAWNFATGNSGLATIDYMPPSTPLRTVDATVMIRGDELCFGGNDGVFYRLDAATGKAKAKYFSGAPIVSKAASIDGQLFFVDLTGRVFECVE